MIDIYCSKCEHDFKAEVWEPGQCPQCGRKYHWDEFCTEDFSDCWAEVIWDD